jgi:CHAD domain-containing protein
MKTKLKPGGKLPRRLRRVMKGQIDRVIGLLAEPLSRPGKDSVHAARKELKKTRAALRLVRPVLGGAVRRAEDEVFRSSGRALAQQRDDEVLLKTLEKLRVRNRDAAEGVGFVRLHRALLARHREHSAGLGEERRQCQAALQSARQRVKDWPLDEARWKDLSRGIRRTYQQGREAFEKAGDTRTAEHLHEWRKRVKDLWYQLCILRPVRPHALAKLARKMKELSEHLGDDHDLVLLSGAATAAELDPHELDLLGRMIRKRRAKLQRTAFEIGRRLYAGTPVNFSRRIRNYGRGRWRR